MKIFFVIVLPFLMVFACSSCATPPTPPGYQKVTDKEGDVDYISEPRRVGKDIVIEGRPSPMNPLTDEIRDDMKDRDEEIDSDLGLDT